VDHACLLMIQRSELGWKIAASDPAEGQFTLTVTIGSQSTAVVLPGGVAAGSSVSAKISIVNAERSVVSERGSTKQRRRM
jgi:hypothetical protein